MFIYKLPSVQIPTRVIVDLDNISLYIRIFEKLYN